MKLFYNFGKRTMLFLFAALLAAPALAQQGYAVYDGNINTLTFKYGNPTGTANVDYYLVDNTGDEVPWKAYATKISYVNIEESFKNARPKTCKRWFYSFQKLVYLSGIENLNTEEVESMEYMFAFCLRLQELDVSGFNTQKVTNMANMFARCGYVKNLDVSGFKTQNVTDMSSMFAGCYLVHEIDVSGFDTHNVTNFASMFFNCQKVKSLDVSGFNTAKATNMSSMFRFCQNLTTLDVSKFETQNVTDMSHMFGMCSMLASLDVSAFNTQNVTNMNCMFQSCRKLNLIDVSGFKTANVTDMSQMFESCALIQTLDVSGFNTQNVRNMYGMFNGCRNLEDVDVSGFDTYNVAAMGSMFQWCEKLKTIDVSGFNTQNVKNMIGMFNGCKMVQKLDVSGFDTKNVQYFSDMFKGCESLTSLDVSNFNTKASTHINSMFSGCKQLKSLTFGKDFSYVKYKNNVFYNDESLRFIDFKACDQIDAITEVNRENEMFKNVPRTTVIYLPHGSQTVTEKENVVYSYNGDANDLRCPRYYSEDKVDIELPHDFITHEAEYKRSTVNEKGTVILPYAFTSNENVRGYTLDEEHTTAMWFESTKTVPAHTPFVFRNLSGTSTADFTQTDDSQNFGITVFATRDTELHPDGPYTASTNLSGWTMKGYYVNQAVDSYSNLYYVQNDHFTRANGETLQFPPHRVTFHGTWAISPSGSSAGAPNYEIKLIDKGTTAIEGIETGNTSVETEAIFDTSGRRLAALKKGVNIIRLKNGTTKKVIIK